MIIIAMGDNAINATLNTMPPHCAAAAACIIISLLQRDDNVMPPNTMLIANYICIITFILSLYGI